MIWVKIVGAPSMGTVADGATVSVGDVVEVKDDTARSLIRYGWAVPCAAPTPVGDPPVATLRARVR
jgi:hypothetical protein